MSVGEAPDMNDFGQELEHDRISRIANKIATKIAIASNIELLHIGRDNFNIRTIKNRRFTYNDRTGELVLGSNNINISSHSQEWLDSGAQGEINDAVRGWIGFGGNYKDGIIHFAPPEQFHSGYDTLAMFLKHGATKETIVRGFANQGEMTIGEAILGEKPRSIAAKESPVEIKISVLGDASQSLARMLRHIQKLGNMGHSFEIVVDPRNSDYKKTFGFDGDGSDKIQEILVDGKPVPKAS